MKKQTLLLFALLFLPLMASMEAQDRINLTGNWQFSFEKEGQTSTVIDHASLLQKTRKTVSSAKMQYNLMQR